MEFFNFWWGLYAIFSGVFLAAYILLIRQYMLIWERIPIWEIPVGFEASTKFSILIPARNEAEEIERCLTAIFKQDYPAALMEVIVIDDFSTDDTAVLVENFGKTKGIKNLHLIQLANHINPDETQSFKKKALEIGIAKATGTLIITTDADCVVSPDWLNLLVSFYEKNDLVFVSAPVNFYQENNLLEKFQSLDFMGMMCVTGAGIHSSLQKMCNGANLAYTREAFLNVGGFAGVDQLASGDDMLLMHKIVEQYPDKIGFLKNKHATVFTRAKPDWKSFVAQRLRWATKNGSYSDWKVTAVLAMVFFFCCNIVLSILLIPIFGWTALAIFFVQLAGKLMADYFFLNKMTTFFERKKLMKVYLPSQILHVIYIVKIGFLANVKKKYVWKGRLVK